MKMLKRILVCLDFTSPHQPVLDAAESLARSFGSELVLLHVLPLRGGALPESALVMAREGAAQRLANCREELAKAGATVADPVVREGVAFDQIIRESEFCDANLILLGSRARDAENKAVFGTTAERLCRKANKPIWMVRGPNTFVVREILCPIDLSDASKRALKNAIHLARKLQAALTVLHVVEPTESDFLPEGPRDANQTRDRTAEEEKQVDTFLAEFDFTDVTLKRNLRVGARVSDEILAACAEQEPGLVIMGSVGRSGLARILLGSVAGSVARRAPCSVALVKAEDAVRVTLEQNITDVGSSYAEGQELLKQGFLEPALHRFEYCVQANEFFIAGWQAMAEVLERLGNTERAAECRETVKRVEDLIYWKRVEADIRSRHTLWGKP